MELNLKAELKGKLKSIIHVGAHEGQERDFYNEMGAKSVIWYEASPAMCSRLRKRLEGFELHSAVNCAVSDFNGRIKFNISNNDGSSSSILNLKDHRNYYPHIHYENQVEVDCVTLDNQHEGEYELYNALFIDVQGAEYKVLKGAENMLKTSIQYVYTEVNFKELYEGCELISEIDSYLSQFGFVRTHLHDTNHGWGDAFYQKVSK